MTRAERKLQERFLATENARWPRELAPVPRDKWPPVPAGWATPVAMFRSMYFLVQVFEEASGHRLTISRTVIQGWRDGHPVWADGISWEEMRRLKAEAGFGNRWAVEIFPPDSDVVNAANMRHLWVLVDAPSFGWRRRADHGRPA